ncbi:TetR/AcrR family transcriptional regulator [Alkalicoccobacillus murimartini]|uniref:AcrR family transcriptional regulator n=1 Tax=Alkalicoccobacillus murimartini TaxID=171685 RepID=A0ABT9YLH4_9BACI|nr:TetR/AcrR family transcriptional regulator [Alkalicoccobacillus murimartini]MDQ0208731.1 AcrR family transcriptional regulator [Alkalicoccobacillus murimartini]
MCDSAQNQDEEIKRGRPMDLSRNEVIIDTTLELLAQVGYDALTIDAIAHNAKVGKATIYRRWSSKEELVIEAVSSISPFESMRDKINLNQNLRDQFINLLCFCFHQEHEVYHQVMTAIGSALPHNKELERGLHNDFYQKLRSALSATMQPFLRRDRPLSSSELELFADVGPALMIYRMFIVQKPFDRPYIEGIVDNLMLPMLEKQLNSANEK